MKFQITAIEFDFSLDYGELIGEEQEVIYDEVLGQIWEADDEDDLVEKITESTDWPIKSIEISKDL